MTDSALENFLDLIVSPAIAEYIEAEAELTQAALADDEERLARARVMVFRRARTAAIELHQFADRVAEAVPPWAPPGVVAIRGWLKNEHSRTIDCEPVEDVDLLHDVADAFKHCSLDKPRKRPWLVKSDRAVVTTQTGYGRLGYGEGKYGGVEQVIVQTEDGRQRALSLVFGTVEAAWHRALGRKVQPPYGRV